MQLHWLTRELKNCCLRELVSTKPIFEICALVNYGAIQCSRLAVNLLLALQSIALRYLKRGAAATQQAKGEKLTCHSLDVAYPMCMKLGLGCKPAGLRSNFEEGRKLSPLSLIMSESLPTASLMTTPKPSLIQSASERRSGASPGAVCGIPSPAQNFAAYSETALRNRLHRSGNPDGTLWNPALESGISHGSVNIYR